MQLLPRNSAETFLPARQVCGRYVVVDRTINRWLKDHDLGFPRPIVINNRRYWRIADLEKWERTRVRGKKNNAAGYQSRPSEGDCLDAVTSEDVLPLLKPRALLPALADPGELCSSAVGNVHGPPASGGGGGLALPCRRQALRPRPL